MIGLSTQQFDVNGAFIFDDKNLNFDDLTSNNVERRLSKVKTLDSGVYIDDSGYVPGDIDIVISTINVSSITYGYLANIFKYHSFVIITTRDGNFLCVPKTLQTKTGSTVMVFSTKDNV